MNYRPCPALRPFVAGMWYFAGHLSHARERILPGGTMQILVNLNEDELRSYREPLDREPQRIAGAGLCGPHRRYFGIDTANQRAILGVNFHPGGAFPFFRASTEAFVDQHVALSDLWGRDGQVLRERLLCARTPEAQLRVLERVLLERQAHPLEPDACLHAAIAALKRGALVGDVGEQLGMPPRRLIRLFKRKLGLTPKRYARIQRLRGLVGSLDFEQRVDWARAANGGGYADQAHLIHEFRALTGLRPTEYRPRSADEHAHVVAD